MNLLEISNNYKHTAEKFLDESGLLSILKNYGRIEFEGAFAGNVMMHGDVDIRVVGDMDYSNEETFIILKDSHDSCPDIRSLFIKADWDDPRFGKQFPKGKYIGVKTYINDERWK